MTPQLILVISIALRLIAAGWSVRILVRVRDWRIGFLTVVLSLMAGRQLLTLLAGAGSEPSILVELPALFVSAMAVFAVFMVERDFLDHLSMLAALRSSEERYRGLVEDQIDLVCQFKPDGTLTFVNRAYADYFGREIDDLVGTSFLNLIPESERPAMREYLAGFGPENQVARIVHAVILPSGETRWQEWTDHAFIDDSGRVTGLQSIGRDVTERKLAVDALRSSEELNRRIIEALPGGIVHLDREGLVIRANEEAQRILGIPAERLSDVRVANLEPWTVYENGVTCPAEEFPANRCLETGEVQKPLTLGTLRPDGEISWAVFTAVPVRDPASDELAGAVMTFLDITGRKLSEEALRNSEANYRALVQAVPDAMFRVTKDGVYIDFIPAEGFETLTKPENFLGRTVDEVLPPEIARRAMKHLKEALRSGQTRQFEYELEMNGSPSYYETRVVPDRPESALCLVRDITVRRIAEVEKERLLLELESKNRELERFARTVSHDLKSPLITIRGFMEVLEDDRSAATERSRDAIDRINAAARTMLQLLDELLELARAGQIVNPPEDLAYGAIVRAAVDQVAGRIVKRHVRVEIQPDLPVVYADRVRLMQVVQNLLDNAVKFMGRQRNPHIEVGAEDRTSDVLCWVRDNGSGIETENLESVFVVFDRFHREIDGTGVGLALVKRIIESHGGRTWATSDGPGRGSTFFFTLPKRRVLLRPATGSGSAA